MPVNYLLSDFKSALLRNLTVYLEQGEDHEDQIREMLSLACSREAAMTMYRSIVDGFKSWVYCEIKEDYYRMERYEDLLKRWEAAGVSSRQREALERLIVTFDVDNYAPPISKGFLA